VSGATLHAWGYAAQGRGALSNACVTAHHGMLFSLGNTHETRRPGRCAVPGARTHTGRAHAPPAAARTAGPSSQRRLRWPPARPSTGPAGPSLRGRAAPVSGPRRRRLAALSCAGAGVQARPPGPWFVAGMRGPGQGARADMQPSGSPAASSRPLARAGAQPPDRSGRGALLADGARARLVRPCVPTAPQRA